VLKKSLPLQPDQREILFVSFASSYSIQKLLVVGALSSSVENIAQDSD